MDGGEHGGKRLRASNGGNLKMLVSDMCAGTLTGRGGQAIVQVEQSTQTKVKLSRKGHHYPGSYERIVLVTGEQAGVGQALQRILLVIKECADSGKDQVAGSPEQMVARMVVPNSAATIVIGKGGSAINSLTERSGADLKFSERGQYQVHNQRVLTVAGSYDAVVKASIEVLYAIQEDEHMESIMLHDGPAGSSPAPVASMHRPLIAAPYPPPPPPTGPGNQVSSSTASALSRAFGVSITSAPAPAYAPPPPAAHALAAQAAHAPPVQDPSLVEIGFDVIDMMAGTIVGKRGAFIQQVTQQTKASVQISPQNQPPEGIEQGMRRVVISGTLTSVHMAHAMLVQRMAENPSPDHTGPWGRAPGHAPAAH